MQQRVLENLSAKSFVRALVGFGFFVFLALSAWFLPAVSEVRAAQAPTVITYQGKLLVGSLSATTTQSMIISLYTASSGGSIVYTASGTVGTPVALSVTPSNGIFTVQLGGTGTNSLDPSIFQSNQNLYLQITVGGEVMTPRKQLTATPYAFNARYLDGVAATSTASSSTYIPISDAAGNFNLRGITSTGLNVTGTSTFTGVTTFASSTFSSLTSTNIFSALMQFTNLSGTNVTTSFLNVSSSAAFTGTATFATATFSMVSSTNAVIVSATTTNFSTGQLSASTLTVTSVTSTNGNFPTLTFTTAVGTSVTSTNLFATTGRFTNVTSTNLNVLSLLAVNSSSPTALVSIQASSSINPLVIATSTGVNILTVLNSGKVGIGTNSPSADLELTSESTASARGLSIVQINTGVQSAVADFRKARGTAGALTTVANGDYVGAFNFYPYDGTNYLSAAAFGARVSGTVATGLAPTDIFFATNNGASDNNPFANNGVRLLISSNGNIGINTTTPIARLAIQAASSSNPFIIASSTGTNIVTVFNTGVFGVNTNTPQYTMSVGGTLGVGGLSSLQNVTMTNATTTNLSASGALMFGNVTSTNLSVTSLANLLRLGVNSSTPIAQLGVQAEAGNIPFAVASSTGAQLLTINRAGNVGIGNSNPDKLFYISSTTYFDTNGALFLTNANSNNSIGANGINISSLGTNGAGIQLSSAIISSGAAWQMFTKGSGNGDFFFGRASTRDNFVLAANSPSAFFPGVNAGTSVPAGEFTLMAAAGTNASYVPIIARGATNQINPLQIWQDINSSTLALVTSNGSFSIGNSDPTARLTVRASSTDGVVFEAEYTDGGTMAMLSSSTVAVLGRSGAIGSSATGSAALTLGESISRPGVLRLYAGAVQIFGNNNLLWSQLSGQDLVVSNDGTGNTTTYANDSINFNRTNANPDGVFTLNSVGNLSASGTLRVHSSSTLATTTIANRLTIGTPSATAPEFRLALQNDGSIIAKGGAFSQVVGGGEGDILTTTGDGVRMIWYARKAAFRAGVVDGSQWDHANIGLASAAFGYDAVANADTAFAFGSNVTSSGNSTFVGGYQSQAYGSESLAFGQFGFASGSQAIALGNAAYASGSQAVAFGKNVTSTANNAYAFGYNMLVSGANSFGINAISEATSRATRSITDSEVIGLFARGIGMGTSTYLGSSSFVTIQSSSTNANVLALFDHGNNLLLTVASSSIYASDPDGSNPTLNEGASLTTFGSANRYGVLKIVNGVIIFNDGGNGVNGQYSGTYATMAYNGATTSYAVDNIAFYKTASKKAGVFTVNTSGDVTASGTLRVFASQAGPSFVVNSSGVVSIGTTTANNYLTVRGGGTDNTAAVQIGDPGFTNYAGIGFSSTTAMTSANYNIMSGWFDANLYINRATGGSIRFRENNTDQLTIASGGNIGVGTTTPTEQVHLAGGTLLNDTPTPVLVGSSTSTATFVGVYVSGKYAYVANSGSSTMGIYDISNPAFPFLVGTTTAISYGGNGDLMVVDKYAYVPTTDNMRIYDVTNPRAPSLVSVYSDASVGNQIYVSGRYAYLTANGDALRMMDISEPTTPIKISSFTTSTNKAVFVSGRYAYLAAQAFLYVLDTASGTLSQVGSVGLTSVNGEKDIHVSGRYAYIADNSGGFRIADVSNPAAPVLIASSSLSSAVTLHVSGRYAYIGDGSTLRIYDVSSSTAPGQVSSLAMASTIYGIQVVGRYAYLATGVGLKVVDLQGISTHAASISSLDTDSLNVFDNAEIGNNLYVRTGINVGASGIFSNGMLTVNLPTSSPGLTTNYAAANFISHGSTTVVIVDKHNSDGILMSFRRGGTEQGTIAVGGGTVSYNAFTGSHYARLPEGVSNMQMGMLMTLTGDNDFLHDDDSSEIIYGVTSTAVANDSRVLGSYLALQTPGSYASSNPHMIMAVGNGVMWVADKGVNIEPGDYLISSDVAGHAMKDVGEYDLSYIIARSAESVDWSTVTSTIDGVKHAKISVFYENFTKDNRLAKSFTIDTASTTVTLGTSSSTYALKLKNSLSFTDLGASDVTFAGNARFTSALPDSPAARAFVFNALNLADPTASVVTIQSASQNVLSVKANGDLIASGSVTAAQFITGTSTLDLAENYPVDPTCAANGTCPEAGDTVCLVDGAVATIQKCSSPYSDKAIGIVSTNPGFTLGGAGDASTRKVALAGRVPLKISTKNGAIAVGDKLTTSDVAGVAIKATASGPTIGVALADYSDVQDGTVLAFVKMGWWAPLSISAPTIAETPSSTLSVMVSSVIQTLESIGVFIQNGIVRATGFISATITSDQVDTKKLCVDGVCITSDQFKDLLDKNNVSTTSSSTIPTSTLPVGEPMPTDPTTSTLDTATSSTNPIIETPSSTPSGGGTETTTPPATEPAPAPAPEPTPAVDPAPAPEPAPAPAPEPVPTPAPAP